MKQYTTAEIETLLLAIDKKLKRPFVITVIGGAAAALAYRAADFTRDIDTSNSTREIEYAHKSAMKETGLQIPFGPAGVWDGPHEMDSRLQRLKLTGLRMLTIMVPEKHDWVLMKVVRGYEHDLKMTCRGSDQETKLVRAPLFRKRHDKTGVRASFVDSKRAAVI